MRIIYDGFTTEEMENVFNNNTTIYPSTDGHAWLCTDMDVFNELDNRFKFKEADVYAIDLETYIRNQYEDEYFDYLGCDICLADYAECVLHFVDDTGLEGKDWDKTIDEHIKAYVMTEVRFQVDEALKKMVDAGWDLSELTDLVEYATRYGSQK
jgi:hypothetical protein